MIELSFYDDLRFFLPPRRRLRPSSPPPLQIPFLLLIGSAPVWAVSRLSDVFDTLQGSSVLHKIIFVEEPLLSTATRDITSPG